MSVFKIPTQKQMRVELYQRVFKLFKAIMMNSKSIKKSYDVRATKRLRRNVFEYTKDKGMVLSYGGIKYLANEAYFMSLYFENDHNKELMQKISAQLDAFAEWYEPFIL